MPVAAGIGLRAPHVARVLAEHPRIAWLEMHSENLFSAGGALHAAMERIRAEYPLSLHGVGLSLGSADVLDAAHLEHLKALVDRYQPSLVSEHLCWCAVEGRHSNDLLPLPFTEEALALLVSRIGQVQEALGREILVENISTYLRFRGGDYSEWDFVAEVARRSGCGLLCDVNNVYVNSVNHGFDPRAYLRALPRAAVKEIHLAGFTRKEGLPVPLLIDSHNQRVDAAVWDLYDDAIALFGQVPTLIEWDQDLPELEVLLDEADRAENILWKHAAPPLAELQRVFLAASCGDDASGLDAEIPCAGLDPAARLRIYRHSGSAIQTGALRTVYPAVRALVGDAYFEQAAEGYRRAHPSRSGNLQDFGAHFAEYLQTLPGLDAHAYLPDVARLEWLRQESALAAEATTLAQGACAGIEAAHRIQLHPGVRLLASPHPVLTIWHYAIAPAPENLLLDGESENVVLWRDDGEVAMAALDAASFACIAVLASGGTFDAACSAARARDAVFDAAACIASLFRCGLVTAIAPSASIIEEPCPCP